MGKYEDKKCRKKELSFVCYNLKVETTYNKSAITRKIEDRKKNRIVFLFAISSAKKQNANRRSNVYTCQ